jgi:GH35 family endo-1,4-beta-xylanase
LYDFAGMRGAWRQQGGHRLSGLAIAIAVASVSLLAATGASATVRSEFYGVVQTATLDYQDIQGLHTAHVRTNRFVLKWGWIEPSKNSFKWKSSDQFIGELAYNGIRTVPSVWGNPGWVPGSGSTPPIGGTTSEGYWRGFLRAMVGRYGPGGTYWQGPYHQQFGANAKPLPIQAWQVWNEPNLKKFFAPNPSPGKYAHLLQISHDAIRSKDPKAQIVLAGMPAKGDVKAADFLKSMYSVQNIKNFFDAGALHPYAPTLGEMQQDIQKYRAVMKQHGDASKPLWITELAWGSAPPDSFGINKGPAGQAQLLTRAYKLILDHRSAWDIQRLFWYHWRDPQHTQASCSFCSSAGLFNFNRTPKPAYAAFTNFTADTTKPTATILSGPANGGNINDPTPTFTFKSSEPGSTFLCSTGGALKDCSSPFTAPHLSDGTHVFFVRATDAAGNTSTPAGRYFNVDTTPPATPKITATSPASPANNNSPKVLGTSAGGTTVKIYKTAGCTGTPAATGAGSQFHSPGLTVNVPDNSTTALRAKATDAAGNASKCTAAAFNYVEDSTP